MRPLHIPKFEELPAEAQGEARSRYQDHRPASRQACYFLQLPAEILNRIYEEVLVHDAVLWVDPEGVPIDKIRDDVLTDGRRFQYLPSEPALTRTCRKVRRETLPIFYGRNIFSDTPVDLCCIKFLIYLTPAKRKMLKQIRISHWKYYAEIFLHIDPGPVGSSVENVRARLERMSAWLRRGGIDLDEHALHFPIRWKAGEPEICINSGTMTHELDYDSV